MVGGPRTGGGDGLNRLKNTIDAIHEAELRAGRPPGSVRLIAVSKMQPRERIEPVLESGHRVFGENRVQEAAGRWPEYRERFPDLALHLVGPLQTNKIRQALGLFDAIHSLDRPGLARKLARAIQVAGRSPELFVQVNTGEEPQKSGVAPADADGFIRECRSMDLPVTGLMVIPPVDEEPSLHFALLRKIAERNCLDRLSMGMSSDFDIAIAFGATHVRIGSAVFGERPLSLNDHP